MSDAHGSGASPEGPQAQAPAGTPADLPSTPQVGSAAIAAIELRPQGAGYIVTGIAVDGTVVSSGPSVADLPMGIAVARGIARLAEFQQDGDVFRATVI